ncbi:hypothetical protein IWZ01DRAFT_493238 [Phyllosticta capitalensis]
MEGRSHGAPPLALMRPPAKRACGTVVLCQVPIALLCSGGLSAVVMIVGSGGTAALCVFLGFSSGGLSFHLLSAHVLYLLPPFCVLSFPDVFVLESSGPPLFLLCVVPGCIREGALSGKVSSGPVMSTFLSFSSPFQYPPACPIAFSLKA